jgi:hypothetical protein
MKSRIIRLLSILVLSCLFAVNLSPAKQVKAAGASLFFTPSAGTFVIGDKFTITVKAFVGGASINAAEGLINFDKNRLEVAGVSDGGSIFSLWTTQPNFSNSGGTVSFGGGIQSPGFSGQQGKVISISFKAKAVGSALVRFSSGAILANDGNGSNILESMGSANFNIVPKEAAPTIDNTAGDQLSSASSTVAKAGSKIEPMEKLAAGEEGDGYLKTYITSPTNGDQNRWLNNNDVQLQWAVPQGATVMSIALNKDYKGEPPAKPQPLLTDKAFENLADGIWFFHLRFYDGQKWGSVNHYRLLIDTGRPQPLNIAVRQPDANSLPKLYFKTSDQVSGVDHYEVYVNSFEDKEISLPEDEAASELSVQLANLEYGRHTALIKVIDQAGNETISTADFEVQPIESPLVKNYAKEIKSSDQFFMSGTSLPNVNVNIYIQNQDNRVLASAVHSDQNGNWFFLGQPDLKNGRFVAWAEAENQEGLRSMPSEKVSFLVSPPVFAVIGDFVINYFTVFASLIFIVVLTALALFYLVGLIRKRLKKETVEVELVLQQNLANLKKIVDDEVAKLAKLAPAPAVQKEGRRMKDTFGKQVDQAKKKILKEIKDVEDILK